MKNTFYQVTGIKLTKLQARLIKDFIRMVAILFLGGVALLTTAFIKNVVSPECVHEI